MAEPSFFTPPTPVTIAEIAEFTGAGIAPDADRNLPISGVAPLDRANRHQVSFFEGIRFERALAATQAGACFCPARYAGLVPTGTVALVVGRPHQAFALVANRLYPGAARPIAVTGTSGVSPAAYVDASAVLEAEVTVEPFAVIGPSAEIGRGSLIGPGAVIGPGVRIGRDVTIGAGATVTHSLIGNRVVLHPGVRLGQDGFGYVPGASGHMKIAQIGRVVIQDDVEIGANTAIDRGSNRDTIIGEGSKIDNQVQIGHNVVIGRHCLIAGQAGISGSVTIGDFVMLGGHAGIRDNVFIGTGARVAAAAGVHTDIPAGETWAGVPAVPIKSFQSQIRAMRRLSGKASEPRGRHQGRGDSQEPGDG